MAFSGFSKDTTAFLRELEKDNSKAFFDANKARFERVWVAPARDFVVEVGEKVQKIAKSIEFEPRVGGSLMRMNRDIRFSKDKSPYKTHLDLFFWDGDEKGWGRPGFFFRLTKDALLVGAGMHAFEKDHLTKYRAAVLDARRGPALAQIVAALEKAGVTVGEEAYKKVPKGLDPEHPRARLLRFGSLHAMRTTKVPAELTSPKLVGLVVDRFAEVAKLRAWLAGALDA
jgi:uncharacterized protein (TIGR02453 family)